ncbi:MAG: CHAD domain-containing protein [Polyangiaceae bacterium]|nr:CHAD domain-containing protein [Polyangiaceae bacterium]
MSDDRHPRAGAYAVKKLRELDAVLVETIPRVRDHADDEAIHDLRVAIRRLRTMLKMTRSLFGRWHSDVVRRAFTDVMRATGELRDEEVLEETLADAADDPSFSHWVKSRSAREKKLRHAVGVRIERGELDRARLLLKAMLVFHVDPGRDLDLSRFARRTVEKARRVVEKRRDVEVADVLGLHELRIAYKELRYAIELLAEALPLDARAMLEPSVVFQKRLGEIHDVDAAIETVTSARHLKPQVKDNALSTLQQTRAKRVAKYLRELDPLGSAAQQVSESGRAGPQQEEALEKALGEVDASTKESLSS